jgi:hypothetical protein
MHVGRARVLLRLSLGVVLLVCVHQRGVVVLVAVVLSSMLELPERPAGVVM